MSAPGDFLPITALEEERDAVRKRLRGWRQLPPTKADVRVSDAATIEARFGDGACASSVIVCRVGMGRLPATAATHDAIRRWAPDDLILIGIAGGLKSAGIGQGKDRDPLVSFSGRSPPAGVRAFD